MKITLKLVMTISAIVACPYGICFMIMPETMLEPYGLVLGEAGALMTRMYGAQIFGIGLISWLCRGTPDSPARRGVVTGFFVIDIVNVGTALFAILTGAINESGWFEVVMLTPFAIAFGYFTFFPERADGHSSSVTIASEA